MGRRAEAVGRAPLAPRAPAIPRVAENAETVREVLPEQGARDALAAQEAMNARWAPAGLEDSVAPPSGVRMSDALLEPDETIEDSMLSFKVYTMAELEGRSDAPRPRRASRSDNWQTLGAAFRAFASASLEWVKIKGMRPNPKVALRRPFDALGDELQVTVESVDWQTLGVRIGIVVGASLTLLFGVLTVAELTDPLRPSGSGAHLAISESSVPAGRTPLDTHGVAPATNMAAQGAQLVAPASPDPTSAGELDEEPAVPAKKPAKKAAAKKTTKLTFRNPDAIFQNR